MGESWAFFPGNTKEGPHNTQHNTNPGTAGEARGTPAVQKMGMHGAVKC